MWDTNCDEEGVNIGTIYNHIIQYMYVQPCVHIYSTWTHWMSITCLAFQAAPKSPRRCRDEGWDSCQIANFQLSFLAYTR